MTSWGTAKGIAQFIDSSWKTWGNGGDVWNPHDAIPAQGRMMCALSQNDDVVNAARKQATGGVEITKIPLSYTLAAYNAGHGCLHAEPGNCNDVKSYTWVGVPPFGESRDYIHKIQDWAGVYDGMDPTFAAKIKALFEDPEVHNNLWMRFGYRTHDEQKTLWDQALAVSNGDVTAAQWKAANPADTTSNHMRGTAADINGDEALLGRLAPKYGLCRPLLHSPHPEWWHVESC